jgi:hypothetical protein
MIPKSIRIKRTIPMREDQHQQVPQLLARILSNVFWFCPWCKRPTTWKTVNWRFPRWQCPECKRKIELGVAFNKTIDTLPPYGAARWVERSIADRLWNRVNFAEGRRWDGEISGLVDFLCPNCAYRQRAWPEQPECWVACMECGAIFFVGLILWQLRPGAQVMTPDDWVMPGLTSAEKEWSKRVVESFRSYRRRIRGGESIDTAEIEAAPVRERAARAAGPALLDRGGR